MFIFNVIESIGDITIKFLDAIHEALKFIILCLIHMVNPHSYNSAMRMVLIKQIYFTAVTILPLFIIMATFFGSVVIGVVIVIATKYSLENEIGSIIISFVIDANFAIEPLRR